MTISKREYEEAIAPMLEAARDFLEDPTHSRAITLRNSGRALYRLEKRERQLAGLDPAEQIAVKAKASAEKLSRSRKTANN